MILYVLTEQNVHTLFTVYLFTSACIQWNHFTILRPKSEQLNKPITAVLAAASMIGIMPLEFVTKVEADPSKRFRICV